MPKAENNNFQLKALCIIFGIVVFFFYSSPVYCAKKHYYYLQVGSFRTVPEALAFSQKLHSINETELIRGEDIPDIGYWYRVYLGPFSSFKQASQKRLELRKKGFYAKGAFIHKKKSLIPTGLQEVTELPEKKAQTTAEKEFVETVSEKQAAALVSKSDTEQAMAKEKMSAEARHSAETPDQKESSEVKKEASSTSSMVAASAPNQKLNFSKATKRGKGRNIAKGAFALGINHTYLETKTELTNRKLITSNGTTTTTQDVSLANIDQNSFPTAMHVTTIRVRFGLTDAVEVFADLGAAYDKLDDLEAAYGGGVRVNLFEVPAGRVGNFYLALGGEYLGGKYKEEYDSDSGGYRWQKESDWQKFSSKVELGVSRNKFTAYIGGLYFLYDEDTDRNLLQNIPSPNTSYLQQDELEQEYNYGAYGGVSYHFTPALLFYIEGQVIHQKSISAAMEYHF